MSGLPEAVRKQAEKAEELTKGLAEQHKDTSEETPADAPSETVEKPKESEVPEAPRDEWKDRYSTLKGKYDHEVPRLHSELRQMRDQMQAMNQQLQQRKEETPAKPDLNIDAFEEYGEEFSTLAREHAEQKAEIARLKAAMGDVVQGQQMSRQEQFWAQLKGRLPEWEEQNNDPKFLEWLASSDPVSGISPQAVLDKAQKTLDVNRVVAVFNAWPNKPSTTKKRSSVESQVAPSRSGTNANGNTPSQATYSRGDIAEFYKMSATNRFPFSFKGKMITSEEEAGAVSRDISLAPSEGRIAY